MEALKVAYQLHRVPLEERLVWDGWDDQIRSQIQVRSRADMVLGLILRLYPAPARNPYFLQIHTKFRDRQAMRTSQTFSICSPWSPTKNTTVTRMT